MVQSLNKSRCSMMPNNKLVIRRLPPTLSEDEFLKQISPLPDHDYFCYFEAGTGSVPYSFCRAYINFLSHDGLMKFCEKFDNHKFVDKDGHEYPAIMEQAFWQKSPSSGPFYTGQHVSGRSEACGKVGSPGKIEQDKDFLEFMDKLEAKNDPQQSPIQTLESNLDEITNASGNNSSRIKNSKEVMTPLIGYINKKRSFKAQRKAK